MKQGWLQTENGNSHEDFAPVSMADLIYMDNSKTQTVKQAVESLSSTGDVPVIVCSTTAPVSPVEGMIWLKPAT